MTSLPTPPAIAPTNIAGGHNTPHTAHAITPRPQPDEEPKWNPVTSTAVRSMTAPSTSAPGLTARSKSTQSDVAPSRVS